VTFAQLNMTLFARALLSRAVCK